MGVVTQYEVRDGKPQFVESTDNLNPKKGVRVAGDIIQFGLTQNEIDDVYKRRILSPRLGPLRCLSCLQAGNGQTCSLTPG